MTDSMTVSPYLRDKERAHRAFDLRFDEQRTWQSIADELGYSGPGSAYRAVNRLIAPNGAIPNAEERRMEYVELVDSAMHEMHDRVKKTGSAAAARSLARLAMAMAHLVKAGGE